MTDDSAKPPRFPYAGALLCAACVGTAGYLWMRYSYAWDVTPPDVWRARPRVCPHYEYGTGPFRQYRSPVDGHYVRIRGTVVKVEHPFAVIQCETEPDVEVSVTITVGQAERLKLGQEASFVGHVRYFTGPDDWSPGVICSNRLTAASIAGLVVGAMGVFVFTVALRHWLGERRRFLEEERA